jgi:uncharacterized protein (DUF1697 family)
MPKQPYAAFYRNLNLGRARCPSKAELEEAFHEAGAKTASSFLVNGTIAFEATSAREAERIVARASASMNERCGLVEPAFVRAIPYLAALVASDPFAGVDRADIYDVYVTFLAPKVVVTDATPRSTPRKDVEVVRFTDAEALCISRKITKSPGSPNALFEKAFERPATTRAWNTVVRLVAKHG